MELNRVTQHAARRRAATPRISTQRLFKKGLNVNKIIPQLSIDTRLLFDRMIDTPVGDTVTYAVMSEIIGRDSQISGRGTVASARRKAMNERRMVFASVLNVGLRRLADVEIVDTAEHDMVRLRRSARRATRKVSMVDFDVLPNDRKIKHNTYMSVFGALHQLTAPKAVRAVESKVSQAQAALPLALTLDAFRGAK